MSEREAFEKWWHDEYLKYQPIDLVYASDAEKSKPAVYKIWSIGYQAALASQEPVGEVTHAEVFANGATTTNQNLIA
jgi:hypothetical protein